MAGVAQKRPVVFRLDPIEGHLPAKSVERPVFILEHRSQQVLLATGEDVGNVVGPLDGMTNRAFQAG